MNSEQFLDRVIAGRVAKGLVLRFNVPDRSDVFTCYPKDEAQKVAWLASAEAKGWVIAA